MGGRRYCTKRGCNKEAPKKCRWCGVCLRCKDHCGCKGANKQGRRAPRAAGAAREEEKRLRVAQPATEPAELTTLPRPVGRPLGLTCRFLDGSSFLEEVLADIGNASSVVIASYLRLVFVRLTTWAFLFRGKAQRAS